MKSFSPQNNFLYFLMLFFVFISSASLAISKNILTPPSAPLPAVAGASENLPPLPVIDNVSSFPIISAESALAVDIESNTVLFEKNPDVQLLPASTTKIITALVSLDAYPLDKVLEVPKDIIKVDGQKMGLTPREKIKVEDLLYGLLVYSANDAAETLAKNYSQGREAFIKAMNVKVQDLSMENSHFANPVGFDEDDQHSTARDLVKAAEVAMRNPEFAKIVATRQVLVHDASGKISYNLKNINQLLGTVPGVMGVKTGWTENARENLVTYIERDGHKIMVVVLGSQDRFGETKELIDWIFTSYKWE